MRLFTYLHSRTSLFTKVLVANAAIVVIGSVSAVLIATHFWHGEAHSPAWEIGLIAVGLAVSLGVNYALLRLAFHPLFTLHATLDKVRRGDFSARVPKVEGDPDIARLTEMANLMLDRLAEHRQAVAAQILRAQEEERKRIARELHDETAQSLTSIVVNLEAVERLVGSDNDEALRERLRLTKDIAQRTLDETRRLMMDLRPSVLDDLGLVPALRWFINQRVLPAGLTADLQTSGLSDRLPEELETALFRILQEAINNVVKHARAKNVVVRLSRENGQITGLVSDDGRGFHVVHTVGKPVRDRGLGLFGMQERAALVGGKVEIESAPGRGTTVRVTVPERRGGEGQFETDSRLAGGRPRHSP
ncbi:MAG: sensor histidine kinase [Symbiobacterium sp.]|uniref:HAMP domain-containing sensor histidine kinase n=1 Tax=Symbiobacterium sp. TaxID=1971213 RepID=UPI00346392B2